jgi:hypothetical protein
VRVDIAAPALGVPPGGDVDAHLARTRTQLADLAAARPQDAVVALVQLSRYVAVGEVATLLEGTVPQRVFLHAAAAGPAAEVVVVPVSGQAGSGLLRGLCSATAQRRVDEAAEATVLAGTLTGPAPEQLQAREDALATAARATAEAEAFGGACVTAVGALVEAPAEVLVRLQDRDGVRGVEVAPPGADAAGLAVRPLLPGTTGTVPAGEAG